MKKIFTLLFASLCLSLIGSGQNRGLHFDGVNDYITIPEKAGMLTTSNFTVEAWVLPTGSFANTPMILRKTNDAYSSGIELYFGGNGNGYLEADIFRNGQGTGAFYSLPVSWTNQWHHVAVSFDGTNLRLFVDGSQVAVSNASPYPQTTNNSPIYIGSYNAGSMYFPGIMDELRFWNVARTQSQIQASMNTEISAGTANLVAYYRFNQGTADGTNTSITTLIDGVAAHNGTLFNFARTGTTSNFTTGYNAISVLDVKDGSFRATKKGATVQLDWQSEGDRAVHFTVERSRNSTDFSSVAVISAAEAGSKKEYTFSDQSPFSEINYYRIKSTDALGSVSYSKTLAVAMNRSIAGLHLFPNPASSTLQLQLTAPTGIVMIGIKDIAGRTLQTLQATSQGTTLYQTLDISGLPKGVYVITVGEESRTFIRQ